MRRAWWLVLGVLLPCFALHAGAFEPVSGGGYRITGIAVSSRDGSRIPYCRLRVSASAGSGAVRVPQPPVAGRVRPGSGPQRAVQAAPGVGAGSAPMEATADVHGRFQIEVPGPGKWRVQAFARNFERQDYDEHDFFYSGVVLTPEQRSIDLVFRLQPDSTLTGLVRDEAGEAVQFAQVTAETEAQERSQGRWRVAANAVTDDRGRYEMGGLLPGAYRVRVQATPWYAQTARARTLSPQSGNAVAGQQADPSLDVVYAPALYPGVEDESRAETIRLAGGEERQADFQLVPIPATHLKVPRLETPTAADGQSRGPVGVMVMKVSPPGFGPSSTTTEGNETDFGGLSPGLYEVRQIGPEGRMDEGGRQFRVLAGGAGVVDLSTAQPLTKVTLLADGVEGARVNDVIFVDAVTGRSIRSNGRNLGAGGLRRRGPGAAAGEAPAERVAYLAPGQYNVYLPEGDTNGLAGMTVTGARATGLTVEIADGSPTITLHLVAGKGEVLGKATRTGAPSVGAMVLLVPAGLGQPGDLTPIRRDQTNTDGSYQIEGVLPGRYILLAIQDGWGLRWQDASTLAPYLAHGVPVEIAAKEKVVEEIAAQRP